MDLGFHSKWTTTRWLPKWLPRSVTYCLLPANRGDFSSCDGLLSSMKYAQAEVTNAFAAYRNMATKHRRFLEGGWCGRRVITLRLLNRSTISNLVLRPRYPNHQHWEFLSLKRDTRRTI